MPERWVCAGGWGGLQNEWEGSGDDIANIHFGLSRNGFRGHGSREVEKMVGSRRERCL